MFDKDDILTTLQEKANEKIEQLRHEMAQSLFEKNITEETFFVYHKTEQDVVGGPFSTRSHAQPYADDMEDSSLLVVMTEKALKTKLGIEV